MARLAQVALIITSESSAAFLCYSLQPSRRLFELSISKRMPYISLALVRITDQDLVCSSLSYTHTHTHTHTTANGGISQYRQLYATEKAKLRKEPQEGISSTPMAIPDLLQVPLVKKVSMILSNVFDIDEVVIQWFLPVQKIGRMVALISCHDDISATSV